MSERGGQRLTDEQRVDWLRFGLELTGRLERHGNGLVSLL